MNNNSNNSGVLYFNEKLFFKKIATAKDENNTILRKSKASVHIDNAVPLKWHKIIISITKNLVVASIVNYFFVNIFLSLGAY